MKELFFYVVNGSLVPEIRELTSNEKRINNMFSYHILVNFEYGFEFITFSIFDMVNLCKPMPKTKVNKLALSDLNFN